ncbi:MAG: hypothetical protein VX913_01025 [Planctomycetota bacterium]|nr:hypothetical protein [Planctomycetota bacterium]
MGTIACGYCGESFRAGRPSCPHCGSDIRTGWKDADEIEATSVELGGMNDDAYADFLEREGLTPAQVAGWNVPILVATLVLVAILVAIMWI